MYMQGNARKDKSEVGNSGVRMERRYRLSPTDQGDPQREVESGTLRICFTGTGALQENGKQGFMETDCILLLCIPADEFVDGRNLGIDGNQKI